MIVIIFIRGMTQVIIESVEVRFDVLVGISVIDSICKESDYSIDKCILLNSNLY